MTILTDLRFALRSLSRVKGLALTVVATLALGIGANAAIFSVVRGVLLRPRANRDEGRLISIRQSARGIGAENANFSVPEMRDLRARVSTLSAFGDFSQIAFTMVGLGEPRVVRAGVVGGSYFAVMGLRPVLGRLLDATDDGPQAPGAAVLTHRFWTTTLGSDRSVIGRTVRLGDRSATIVRVLEPRPARPARGLGAGFRHRVLQRRQPDPRPLGTARGRAGHPRGARRESLGAAANAAGGKPVAVRGRRDSRGRHCAADGVHPGAICLPLLGARPRPDG